MPYPKEHAARVKNPDFFEPDSFRSKDLKDGVRLILGKLKGGNGSMVVQAYRFSVDKFTVEQAKQWLEDHKVKFIKFEAAQNVSEGNTLGHAGVLGMRWGHRQNDSTAAQLREKRLNQASKNRREIRRAKHTGKKSSQEGKSSDDFKNVAELRKKKINEMSNEDLSKVIKRMELQKRYKDLNPSKAAKGKKAAKDVLGTIGQVSAGVGGAVALAAIGSSFYKKLNQYLNSSQLTSALGG